VVLACQRNAEYSDKAVTEDSADRAAILRDLVRRGVEQLVQEVQHGIRPVTGGMYKMTAEGRRLLELTFGASDPSFHAAGRRFGNCPGGRIRARPRSQHQIDALGVWQKQRLGQPTDCGRVRRPARATLQVGDASTTQTRALGQFLLGQAGSNAVPLQQDRK
jgi:hypothetical protein